MYREKDYNKNGKNGGRVVNKRRVIGGDSVYGDSGRRSRTVRSDSVYPRPDYRQPEETGSGFSRRKAPIYNNDYSKNPRKMKRKKGKRFLWIVLILILLAGPWYYMMGGLNSGSLPRDDDSLGITSDSKFGVINIAFFGVDTRDDSDTGRSDAMMIMSIDVLHGDMKLISLLRDSKVPIEGHGETKLNHAYAYGGAPLAVKTINSVFHTDIKEYVTVNFNQLSGIVDAVGGITLDISEAERGEINHLIDEQFPGSPYLESSGTVTLTGDQAISFSRIRSIDSDNARTDRQQEVLNGIFTSFKNMSVLEYPRFVHDFSKSAETSIGTLDAFKLAPIVFHDFEPERYTVPDIQYETDLDGHKDSDGLWYWHYNLENAAARIHSILWREM